MARRKRQRQQQLVLDQRHADRAAPSASTTSVSSASSRANSASLRASSNVGLLRDRRRERLQAALAHQRHRRRRASPSSGAGPASSCPPLIRHAIVAAPAPAANRSATRGQLARASTSPASDLAARGQFERVEAAMRADVSRPQSPSGIGPSASGRLRVRRRAAIGEASIGRTAQGQTLHNSGLTPSTVKENRENNDFAAHLPPALVARLGLARIAGAARAAGLPFTVVAPEIDETPQPGEAPADYRAPAGRSQGARASRRHIPTHSSSAPTRSPIARARRSASRATATTRWRSFARMRGPDDRLSHRPGAARCAQRALPTRTGRCRQHVSHSSATSDRGLPRARPALRLRRVGQVSRRSASRCSRASQATIRPR